MSRSRTPTEAEVKEILRLFLHQDYGVYRISRQVGISRRLTEETLIHALGREAYTAQRQANFRASRRPGVMAATLSPRDRQKSQPNGTTPDRWNLKPCHIKGLKAREDDIRLRIIAHTLVRDMADMLADPTGQGLRELAEIKRTLTEKLQRGRGRA